MGKLKYAVSNYIEGFEVEKIDYSKYEISFRRWLVSEIELGNMTISEAADRFKFNKTNFQGIYKGWRIKYSTKIHVALQAMTPEERTQVIKLEARIKELEKQLESAQIKTVLTEIMIDLAEEQFKIDIRKKSGPKQ